MAFMGKIVYGDEGALFTFGHNISFREVKEKIRLRFPVLENSSFRLKLFVPPETTQYQLDTDEDLMLGFRVLDANKSDCLVFHVSMDLEVFNHVEQPADSVDAQDGICGLLEANEFLGCYRREDLKLYMSNSWKLLISSEGQQFEGGVKEFRTKLRMYAVEVGFEYTLETNRLDRVIAFCKKKSTDGCKWHVKASLCRFNGAFEIYSLLNEHCCRSVLRLQKSNMVTSDLVKEVIIDRIRDNLNSRAIDIQKDMKLNYGLDVPYHIAWYGKELARQSVLGDEAESYSHLNWFAKTTFEANPGSHIGVECSIEDEGPDQKRRFKRMFVSYGALLNGFQSCRPVLHVDATFITNKYRGMLMSAAAKDANCGMYPVAYAFVDSETESNWIYLLTELSKCLSRFQPRKITFISDRNLGLLKALKTVFPDSPSGFCYRHLQANLTNKYPSSSIKSKTVPALFMMCAYSKTPECFNYNLQNLLKEGGPVVNAFLEDLPLETWVSCFFNGDRLGEMTNNLSECFNSWIKDLKSLPIVEFNEAFRVRTMSLISSRKKESALWVSELCPNMEKQLVHNLNRGRHWIISRSDTYVYEVKCKKHAAVVNLVDFTCSCGEWQVHGFPCSHALASIQYHGSDIYSYVKPIFKVATYRDTYSHAINAVSTISKPVDICRDTLVIHPPLTKRPAGRPRVNRYKSRNEIKRAVKCSRCKKFGGHNRKSCKKII